MRMFSSSSIYIYSYFKDIRKDKINIHSMLNGQSIFIYVYIDTFIHTYTCFGLHWMTICKVEIYGSFVTIDIIVVVWNTIPYHGSWILIHRSQLWANDKHHNHNGIKVSKNNDWWQLNKMQLGSPAFLNWFHWMSATAS